MTTTVTFTEDTTISGTAYTDGQTVAISDADARQAVVNRVAVLGDGPSTMAQDTLKRPTLRFIEKTASYALAAADDVVVFNGTSLTATLPDATSTKVKGRVYRVKNVNATAVTVDSAAGTIDGAASDSVAQWATVAYLSDGTNWLTV